jgi:hypothetical protein
MTSPQHHTPSAGDYKRRLPEMLPTVAGALEQVCVPVMSTLKEMNDEIRIRSFTELFYQAFIHRTRQWLLKSMQKIQRLHTERQKCLSKISYLK